METRTRLLHKIAGVLTVLTFLGTGAYMRFNSPNLFQSDPLVRMMFRSTHIYILMAGLINLAIGSYFLLSPAGWRRILQFTGSAFLLVAPVLLICAFFYEPSSKRAERPLTLPAVILLASGTLSHMMSTARRGINRSSSDLIDHHLAKAAGASDYGKRD